MVYLRIQGYSFADGKTALLTVPPGSAGFQSADAVPPGPRGAIIRSVRAISIHDPQTVRYSTQSSVECTCPNAQRILWSC